MKYFLHACWAMIMGTGFFSAVVTGKWFWATILFLITWLTTWFDFKDDAPPSSAPVDEEYTETPWDRGEKP